MQIMPIMMVLKALREMPMEANSSSTPPTPSVHATPRATPLALGMEDSVDRLSSYANTPALGGVTTTREMGYNHYHQRPGDEVEEAPRHDDSDDYDADEGDEDDYDHCQHDETQSPGTAAFFNDEAVQNLLGLIEQTNDDISRANIELDEIQESLTKMDAAIDRSIEGDREHLARLASDFDAVNAYYEEYPDRHVE